MEPKVMIILGSASDFKIAEKATAILEKLGIYYDLRVASAHRTHEKVKNIVLTATKSGVEVFIGIAGLSAHLPGIMAGITHKPVIGVPVDVKVAGLDALFASVQMPLGAPVATVGIDRGDNAAILAAQIIGIGNADVRERLSSFRKDFYSKIAGDEEKLFLQMKGKYYSKINPTPDQEEVKVVNGNLEGTKNKITTHPGKVRDRNILPQVAVISGSYSDIKVAKKTTMFLDKLNITYDSAVVSPVRSPDKFENFLKRNKDAQIFIAISGLSAHVTGAVVAYTEKPVIGVPCAIKMGGMDALLSMVNMPPGVPVATMGVDAGGNAALLAAEMLGIGDSLIKRDLLRFKGNINCKR
ncbi:5-(carboxyamino)imidazole ribonucleotide mutase [Methanobacterium formicicum]|uniref:N5-carboxyaminoimidazole ribonucleotide mutase n=1 Tax=Methanobacterium formicicum (strain DSM 3637 / PP1) TaxID=1204725 RepID=K2QFG9_METFP|nr:5-(carboxyamino)imidazole ribonucleotide mutase [Methanobacterium formicicum]EKF86821.1 phosphoribosylaminoimidazole carboxylase catalytic subunit [Methanobacterium formicicum DSM 3637]